MSVLMLFLDGVGIGGTDPRENPFAAGSAPVFSSLLGDIPPRFPLGRPGSLTSAMGLDATLGIAGVPQSGTGQATLFTGVNAAKYLGRHFGPYPHSTLHPLLREKNIFRQLSDSGLSGCFANAFPERFFDHMKSHPARLSVTTLTCSMSGVPLLGVDALNSGEAVSADITGAGWKELGHPEVTVIPPEDAGTRLSRLAQRFDFVLFEYWKTDHAGHAMDTLDARTVLDTFDRMLTGLLEVLDEETLLLITSDHGNIEDLSRKTHTLNNVPLVLHGTGHSQMENMIRHHGVADLSSITPAIVKFLNEAR